MPIIAAPWRWRRRALTPLNRKQAACGQAVSRISPRELRCLQGVCVRRRRFTETPYNVNSRAPARDYLAVDLKRR